MRDPFFIFGMLFGNEFSKKIKHKFEEWINEGDKEPKNRSILYSLLVPLIFFFMSSIIWYIPLLLFLIFYYDGKPQYGTPVSYLYYILVYLLWFLYIYKRRPKKK